MKIHFPLPFFIIGIFVWFLFFGIALQFFGLLPFPEDQTTGFLILLTIGALIHSLIVAETITATTPTAPDVWDYYSSRKKLQFFAGFVVALLDIGILFLLNQSTGIELPLTASVVLPIAIFFAIPYVLPMIVLKCCRKILKRAPKKCQSGPL